MTNYSMDESRFVYSFIHRWTFVCIVTTLCIYYKEGFMNIYMFLCGPVLSFLWATYVRGLREALGHGTLLGEVHHWGQDMTMYSFALPTLPLARALGN